jgi:alpha-tubulin suppressor-like RCC1 family protein
VVSRAILSAALVAALAACEPGPCADGTAFVRVEIAGNAAAATELALSYAVGAAAQKTATLTREGGARTDSFRIDFADGYPAGQTLFVAVRAQNGGQVLGAAQQSITLAPGCTALDLTIGSGGLALGTPCGGGGCQSGFCVDGVCCDAPCDGQCETCNLPGRAGTCGAASGKPAGARPACTGEGTSCGGTCDGTQRAACAYPTSACRAAGCAAGRFTEAASCQAGTCPEVSRDCPLKACNGADACLAVVSFSAGSGHACAALSDGTLRCWGNGSFNQLGLGDGDKMFRNQPTPVPGLTDIVEVACGGNHTCARHADGTVSCWGFSNAGQNGRSADSGVPAKVAGVAGARTVGMGESHSCATLTNGRALCWGLNAEGELGRGTNTPAFTPTPAPVCPVGSTGTCGAAPATNLDRIDGGNYHTCALTTDKGVACWGLGNDGRIGSTTTTSNPINVVIFGGDVTSVNVGGSYSCATNVAGSALCWGSNGGGLLGAPNAGASSTQPRSVCTSADCMGLLNGAVAVAAGGSSACVRRIGGGLVCWGGNGEGQVGDGTTTTPRPFAVPSSITGGATQLDVGGSFACALVGPEDLRCWGENGVGQLGNGDAALASQPMAVPVAW